MIDFIDMMSNKNQREVENRLRDALKIDRARIQTGRISRFGLMEMSRQRLRPSLGDSTQLTCPRCKGQGTIRNVESVTLAVLRLIEEEAMKKGTERVIAHLPIDCATFLLNEKRAAIQELEARLKVSIVVLPSKHLDTPAYDIERIKSLESTEEKPSHLQIKEDELSVPDFAKQTAPKLEKAAVKEFLPEAPAPVQNKKTSTSLIQRFWQRLIGQSKTEKKTEEPSKKGEGKPKSSRNTRRDRDRPSGGRSRRGNKRNYNPVQSAETDSVSEENKQQSSEAVDNAETTQPKPNGDRPIRRGRNRRRNPRSSNDRKQEQENTNVADSQEPGAIPTNNNTEDQPRSYDSDFAERKQRMESEQQESIPGNGSVPEKVASGSND